jgi:hypothetical protein
VIEEACVERDTTRQMLVLLTRHCRTRDRLEENRS